jgi:hypothetical protein
LQVLEWLAQNEPQDIPDAGLTAPALLMPDQYKNPADPVGSYRNLYIYEKSRFAKWAVGDQETGKMVAEEPPSWYILNPPPFPVSTAPTPTTTTTTATMVKIKRKQTKKRKRVNDDGDIGTDSVETNKLIDAATVDIQVVQVVRRSTRLTPSKKSKA